MTGVQTCALPIPITSLVVTLDTSIPQTRTANVGLRAVFDEFMNPPIMRRYKGLRLLEVWRSLGSPERSWAAGLLPVALLKNPIDGRFAYFQFEGNIGMGLALGF